MATFGLVHGAYHGSSCWERLLPELEHLGHIRLTVDLPCDDPNAGAREYAATAQETFAGAPDDLVSVGHCLGGLSISSRRTPSCFQIGVSLRHVAAPSAARMTK